jgi:Tol biopolymer transport system component
MGEVYRARDTKLNRDVALKILSGAFLADADRLARFRREAQVLASLNHPNIAAIYGFEDSGATHALVLELVDGPTLADRITQGPIALPDAVPVARQIADALEVAHGQGIIHRDLKPANIKVRDDGTVKVLDFGLAKALLPSGAGSTADAMNSPTITTPAMTQAGMILGTAAYMAPEQARGKPVDKRADIWAFGVVLYEMLTGAQLFTEGSVVDTLSAVMRKEIDFDRLPESTPRRVRDLLRRCLERNPKNRLHDIADARIVLEDLLAGRSDERPAAAPAAPTAPAVPPANPWPARIVWLAAGAALSAALLIALRQPPASVAADDASRPFTLRRLTELPGAELQPTLSPDGRMLVYASAAAGNLDLYLLRVGGDRAIQLTSDLADDSRAAFSPDGERIAFRSERDGGGLFVMGATGESVRRVTDDGFDPAWSPDGKKLVYATEWVVDPVSRDATSELWIVEVESGKKTRRLAGDAVQPVWSRQGDRIAYWANTSGQRDLWTVQAERGDPVAVTTDLATDWSPEWSPDGRWLYFSSDRGGSFNLWRIPIDPATGGAAGPPLPLTTGVRGMGYARLASDGSRLSAMAYERSFEQTIYAVESSASNSSLALRPLRTLRNPSARWCSISPDGEHLACNTASAPEDLLVLRTDGSEMRRLTSDLHKDRTPIWDPAGKRLAFYSTRSGGWDFWTIGADGSDLRQRTGIGDITTGSWLPGDRGLVIQREPTGDLYRLDPNRIETVATASAVPSPPASERFAAYSWSHAGDQIAGPEVDVTGGRAVALALWAPGSGSYRRLDLPSGGRGFGSIAGWLPGDRGLIARTSEGVVLIELPSGHHRVLAPAHSSSFVSLSRDGSTLSVENEILDSDIWLLEFEGGPR